MAKNKQKQEKAKRNREYAKKFRKKTGGARRGRPTFSGLSAANKPAAAPAAAGAAPAAAGVKPAAAEAPAEEKESSNTETAASE
ncbi:MAG: hypothetical protein KTR14_02615 [Vampirovibrio sp.]|nr:hypothetical protein [Vampirovibrio sp.]